LLADVMHGMCKTVKIQLTQAARATFIQNNMHIIKFYVNLLGFHTGSNSTLNIHNKH